jgi:hypothetical protein
MVLLYDSFVSNEDGPPGGFPVERWLSGKLKTFLYKVVQPMVYTVAALTVGLYNIYHSVMSGNAESLPIWLFNSKVSIVCSFVFMAGIAIVYAVLIFSLALHVQYVGYCGEFLVVENRRHSARIPFENIEAVEQPLFWIQLVRVRFSCLTPFGSVVYYAPERFVLWPFSQPANELRRLIWPNTP